MRRGSSGDPGLARESGNLIAEHVRPAGAGETQSETFGTEQRASPRGRHCECWRRHEAQCGIPGNGRGWVRTSGLSRVRRALSR
jgi:hypothetical protein